MWLCLVVTIAGHFLAQGYAQDYKCPDGWNLYQEGQTCIKTFETSLKNWVDARVDCQNQGGDLVRNVEHEGFSKFVRGVISKSKNYWVGLHDENHDGSYEWLEENQKTTFGAGGTGRCMQLLGALDGGWWDIKCYKEEPYICQKDAEVVESVTDTQDYKCPEGWNLYQEGQTCIKTFETSLKNWVDARVDCQNKGGDLVRNVEHEGFSKFVRGVISKSKNYWVGLHDENHDGSYEWLEENQKTTFGAGGTGRCMQLLGALDGGWWDIKCYKEEPYICQKDAEVVESVTDTQDYKCPDGWNLYQEGQTCVKTFEVSGKNWADARVDCQNEGGDLVKISDQGFSQFVQGVISKSMRYWIGLHDENHDGKFEWLEENQQTPFEWWNVREPNNHRGNEHCVEALGKRNGKWNDLKCSTKRSYICQKDAEMAEPPTDSKTNVSKLEDVRNVFT